MHTYTHKDIHMYKLTSIHTYKHTDIKHTQVTTQQHNKTKRSNYIRKCINVQHHKNITAYSSVQ